MQILIKIHKAELHNKWSDFDTFKHQLTAEILKEFPDTSIEVEESPFGHSTHAVSTWNSSNSLSIINKVDEIYHRILINFLTK